ncbi:GHMP family kinase ATP-binding protein [Candidatus Lokiarchaeum ossiferum]|uniref:GHMP family kinase ATP-binding protein n=1 Tax=Candidatus Lokiarchaeum ossiferum TaxID=2951803 RepID=UPI00352D7CFC
MNSTKINSSSNRVEVWVPLRISGFFQMQDPSNPHEYRNSDYFVKIGSRGGGPALNAFGKTVIIRQKYSESHLIPKKMQYSIFIDGIDCTSKANTSRSAIELMKPYLNGTDSLIVYHTFDLPQGSGYGSSGAGALGITFGLNKLYKLGLSNDELGKYAHIAEVMNHTGLGTVGGQFVGGLSISLQPGFPFNMQKIEIPSGIRIVVGSFGPISTKLILTDTNYKQLIHLKGRKAMKRMKADFSLLNYMSVCKKFLIETQLLERLNLMDLKSLISALNQISHFGASMNMLGKSVFCICHSNEVEAVKKEFMRFSSIVALQILKICDKGPFFIE